MVGCDLAESPETSIVTGEIGGCELNPALCTNSGGYLHGGMHEMSLLGRPNEQDFRPELDPSTNLPRAWKDGVAYRFDVRDGELLLLDPTGATAFSGDGTVGAEIRMVKNATSARVFDLVVMSHRPFTYRSAR